MTPETMVQFCNALVRANNAGFLRWECDEPWQCEGETAARLPASGLYVIICDDDDTRRRAVEIWETPQTVTGDSEALVEITVEALAPLLSRDDAEGLLRRIVVRGGALRETVNRLISVFGGDVAA